MSDDFIAAKERWHRAQRHLDTVKCGKDPQETARARREATTAASEAVALMDGVKVIPYRCAMRFEEEL